ncbi:MAG: transglycosylase SLT domain-containing protein [Pseudomonadota bacterium]|nr:transglycosylase SLT domain-containing protein [Pseudomonadota bacterium]
MTGLHVSPRMVIAAFAAIFLLTAEALASVPDCEALAEQAAAARGVPSKLLPAIARTESGRGQGKLGHRAWPWTLNVAGKGYYFDTREQALDKLRQVIDSGQRNVDVGCMQVNYRWHGKEFGSIEEMMDPVANTRYAALFMSRLRERTGSWNKATQFYHSQDPKRGHYYLGKVQKIMKKVDPGSFRSEVEIVGGEQNGTITDSTTTSSWQVASAEPATVTPQGSAIRKTIKRQRTDQRFAPRGPLVMVESPLLELAHQMVGEGTVPDMSGKKSNLSAIDVPLSPELALQMDRIKRIRSGFQNGH